MKPDEGFVPLRVGWRPGVPSAWERETVAGLWHRLSCSRDGDSWSAGLHADAVWSVRGRPVPARIRHSPEWSAPARFRHRSDAVAWLDDRRTLHQFAAGLLDGSVAGGRDHWSLALDAASVLTVAGHTAAAHEVLAALTALPPDRADRAELLVARIGAVPLRPDQVAPADAADVLALLTRLISSDLVLARARHRSRRWLVVTAVHALRDVLLDVVVLASPPDRAEAVVAWQEHLERRRAELVTAVGGRWPATLPDVADDLPATASPRTVAAPAVDRSYEAHASSCPRGAPADGRDRVEVFFDYGAFPVWRSGGRRMACLRALGLPPDLTADLWSWAHSHDLHQCPGGEARASGAVARYESERLRVLAARLERVTGLAAPVGRPRGHGDGGCPTAGCEGPA